MDRLGAGAQLAKEIGKRKVPQSYQRAALATHAMASPEIAAWLASPDTITRLDGFDAADAQAGRRQKRYLRTARRATILSTVATAIAALTLLPLEQALGLKQPRWIGLLQFLAVAIAFWSVMRISWSKLLDRWMLARGEAERLRADLFRHLMNSALPLTAQLAAFEECHLDYQRSFYAKRGGELTTAAGGVAPLKLVG
jgi:SMODS and SLOG-associating 2TM effector domain 3